MVLMLHPAFVYADRDNANHPIQYNGTWLRGYTVHATVKLYLPAYTWYQHFKRGGVFSWCE